MPTFEFQSTVPFARDEVFTWFARPGALVRLWPPFGGSVRRPPSDGLNPGSETVVAVTAPGSLGLALSSIGSLLPSAPRPEVKWTARHTRLDEGRSFTDEMVSGPLRSWHHRHTFADHDGGTTITDRVTYELPAPISLALLSSSMTRELDRIFAYRARQVEADLSFHHTVARAPVTVGLTGASGLIGTQVCALLEGAGHRVIRFVRRPPRHGDEIAWDPERGVLEPSGLQQCDAVVHLAGHPIGGRFTAGNRRRILESRRAGTALIARALADVAADGRSRTLVASSAIGYYGAQPHTAQRAGAVPIQGLTEDAAPGDDFLARVCRIWEDECRVAAEAGVRVVNVRTGLVLTPSGGLLTRFLPLYLAGLGGPLGHEQWQSWIGIDDIASIYAFAVLNDGVTGPVNAVAPNPVTADGFASTLGRVLHRPRALPVPAFGPRILLGAQGARELAEADQLVSSAKLELAGYRFRHRDLEAQLRHVLGQG